ncbi:Ca-activated chloride channel family protein [Marinobacter sp. DSM 26671]|jgi:Ca-activated chloride channel family protein|uniref:VWA domain-containing protein n=2 Tax=Marinobacter TaxID=2742 RepID=A0A3D8H717_9GAMM|nr:MULTISPECIES: VWA domain-containing protein [Marinobacter]MEC7727926.1 VWA domain-containing protein [Pseudomonadota bacterium]MAK51153.1 VWA domain-containing protein [Marinobacter sp.]MAM51301.1 VWA domain-containing protein [Marinobacter sp.]MBQ93539.1 VWA domain-containing protein [Marinobacter sp.]MBW3225897.1 VWA domain-containing protein [Marinobacter adhaerens]|tara:strand:- start:508 stop:1536 length:1029 start_codon:yes stop_codon:yes gene_type:complete
MLNLAWPWALVLVLLPLILKWRKPGAQSVDAPVLPVGHWLSDLPGVSRRGNAVPLWQQLLLFLMWTLLVVALARPQHVGEQVQMPVSGRDLMLVVDISPSMDEQDMVLQGRSINRLQAVKRVLDDFISRRQGDRLGLILFGTEPYVQAPLTFDLETVRTLMREAGLGMAGRATAIGDAVGLATKRLRNRPQDQRVVVLLTDGANTAGEITPDKATEIAAAASIRLYTIGIGAESMVQRGLLGSRRVNPSRDLDENLLTRMAQQTGGEYFRARSLPELELIYESIDRLEPIELEGKFYRPVTELYVWPAGLAVILWLALFLVRHGRELVAETRRSKEEETHVG